jgi:YidC/Oxa1 family membrane protein insertase
MENKNLITFLVLSILVILAWSLFFTPKPVSQPVAQPVAQAPVKNAEAPAGTAANTTVPGKLSDLINQPKPAEATSQAIAPVVSADLHANAEETVTITTDRFVAVFTNKGAALQSLILKGYKDDSHKPMDLVSTNANRVGWYPFHFDENPKEGAYKQLNNALFTYAGERHTVLAGTAQRELVFTYADNSQQLLAEKRFLIRADSYRVGLGLRVSKGGKVLEAPVVFGPDLENDRSADRVSTSTLKIASWDGNSLQSNEFAKYKTEKTDNPYIEKIGGDLPVSSFWTAYENNYFAAIFKTNAQKNRLSYSVIKEINGKGSQLYSYLTITNPEAVYLGPKDERMLATIETEFGEVQRIIDYGWFGAIARIMLKGIFLINNYVPNMGWSLILFTIFLKLLLFPLTYMSSVSTAKMQTVQPKIKAIQKKYKGTRDPEQRRQMNVEVMNLYKQEKVNPAGGCLPLLIQLPFLWGFFRLLSVSINMRHAEWIMWLTDLSKKDPYYVLPILLGITQFVIQKMTPSGGDDSQKKIMYAMNIFMLIIFFQFPSGLNLYWFFSNLLQIGQQYWINERIFKQKKDEERQFKLLKRKKGAKGNE